MDGIALAAFCGYAGDRAKASNKHREPCSPTSQSDLAAHARRTLSVDAQGRRRVGMAEPCGYNNRGPSHSASFL